MIKSTIRARKKIRRRVVRFKNYIDPHAHGSGGSNTLYLECGHTTRRKASEGIPITVCCHDCEDWANGNISFKSEGNTVETWDSEKQMPVFTNMNHREENDVS